MPPKFDDILAAYDYSFPRSQIALKPASPRDSAKLLVFDRKTGKTHWTLFSKIGDFLPKRTVLVLNETKVIPARLELRRPTGGKVEVLLLGTIQSGALRVLANKSLRKGELLQLTGKLTFVVEGRNGKEWRLRAKFSLNAKMLARYGKTPLPPYMKQSPLSEAQRRQQYQTVFAKTAGSIAAPTASLHFTKALLRRLKRSSVRMVKITLHVHLGTFAPLTPLQWKAGKLHTEYYTISAPSKKILERAHAAGDPIIAVGTTVVRALESAADAKGRIVRPSGQTALFIREGYIFRLTEGLITNFHVPRSSLLMLVSAFIGRQMLLKLYRLAISRRFRLFSFGDAMLIV